jgi:hypothetical protein
MSSYLNVGEETFELENGNEYRLKLDLEEEGFQPDEIYEEPKEEKFGDIRDYFAPEDLENYKKKIPIPCDNYLKEAVIDKMNELLNGRNGRRLNPGAIGEGWDHTNNIFCEPIRFPVGLFLFAQNHWLPAPLSLEGSGHEDTVFKFYGDTDFLSIIGKYNYVDKPFFATRGSLKNFKIIAASPMKTNSCLINRVGPLHNHLIEGCHLTMFGDPGGWGRCIGASKLNDFNLSEKFENELFSVDEETAGQDSWQMESITRNCHIEGGKVGIEVIGQNCLVIDNLTDYCEVAFFSENLRSSSITDNIFSGQGMHVNGKTKAGVLVAGFNNTFRNRIHSYDSNYFQGYRNNYYGEAYFDVKKSRQEFHTLPFDFRHWKKGQVATATKVGLKKYAERSHIRV